LLEGGRSHVVEDIPTRVRQAGKIRSAGSGWLQATIQPVPRKRRNEHRCRRRDWRPSAMGCWRSS
jgi:hypothetical protein